MSELRIHLARDEDRLHGVGLTACGEAFEVDTPEDLEVARVLAPLADARRQAA